MCGITSTIENLLKRNYPEIRILEHSEITYIPCFDRFIYKLIYVIPFYSKISSKMIYLDVIDLSLPITIDSLELVNANKNKFEIYCLKYSI